MPGDLPSAVIPYIFLVQIGTLLKYDKCPDTGSFTETSTFGSALPTVVARTPAGSDVVVSDFIVSTGQSAPAMMPVRSEERSNKLNMG